jgi:hypothetical protein
VFDNHSDSANYYLTDPVDFASFISRKWFDFTEEEANSLDLIIDEDVYIITSPYYTYNEGFTNENLITYFSGTELGYLYIVLDSIVNKLNNHPTEGAIQQLITNGKSRLNVTNPDHKNELINTLTQLSYSVTLAYDINDLYGPSSGPEAWAFLPCLIYAAMADFETLAIAYSIDSEHISNYVSTAAQISVYAFFHCP